MPRPFKGHEQKNDEKQEQFHPSAVILLVYFLFSHVEILFALNPVHANVT